MKPFEDVTEEAKKEETSENEQDKEVSKFD
jgi:hypothetical protein